jgi:hypothetical protein
MQTGRTNSWQLIYSEMNWRCVPQNGTPTPDLPRRATVFCRIASRKCIQRPGHTQACAQRRWRGAQEVTGPVARVRRLPRAAGEAAQAARQPLAARMAILVGKFDRYVCHTRGMNAIYNSEKWVTGKWNLSGYYWIVECRDLAIASKI